MFLAAYQRYVYYNRVSMNQSCLCLKAPIDVQGDVSGSVLIPISASPTHIQFHFRCFKSWYRADMVSPLSDTEISHVYLKSVKRNRM